MTGRNTRAALACLLAGAAGAAAAFTPRPNDALLARAMSDGQAIAAKHGGYPVKDYIVYDTGDAFTLKPGEGSVEAIQVATPYERARWASYLLAVQEKAVTAASVRKEEGLPPGSIAFLVFAHSQGQDASEQNFLARFGKASFTVGKRVLSSTPSNSGASLANYRDNDGRVVFRWSGQVTYNFDLSRLPAGGSDAQGTLRFKDESGKSYDVKVDLAKYR